MYDDIELFVDRILMKNNEIKKLNIKKVIGVISNKNVWFENNLINTINDNSLKEESLFTYIPMYINQYFHNK